MRPQKTGPYIALATTFVLATPTQAQETLTHQLKVDKELTICDGSGNAGTITGTRTPPAGSNFSISGEKDDFYVIRFWHWNGSEEVEATRGKADAEIAADLVTERATNKNNLFHTDLASGTDLFFLLPKSALGVYTQPLFSRFSPMIGASVLPFKLRPQTGEFTKDLTLAGMGGIKWRPKRKDSFSLGALGGVGITSVGLDSINTEGLVKEPSDRAAITIATGLVVQWERLQVGLFIGWDHLNKADRDLWVHQGSHWLAMGIGVAIFSEEKGATSSNQAD